MLELVPAAGFGEDAGVAKHESDCWSGETDVARVQCVENVPFEESVWVDCCGG